MSDSEGREIGTSILGRGLDIFQYDAVNDVALPLQGQVLDSVQMSTLSSGYPSGGTHEIYGRDYSEFAEKLAVDIGVAGKYGGFSGALHAGLKTSSEVISSSQWIRIQRVIHGDAFSLGEDRAVLRKHLDPDFAEALRSSSPAEVFDAYGTHVVVKVLVGGRASYDCSTSETSTMTQMQFTAAAKAQYSALGGRVEGSIDTAYTSDKYTSQLRGNMELNLHGGTEDAISELLIHRTDDAWERWLESIAERPSALGFQADGLLPLWLLTDDIARQDDLRLEYERRIAQHPVVVAFTATSERTAHPACVVGLPTGYKLLSGGALDENRPPDEGNHLYASFPNSDRGWEVRGKDHLEKSPSTVTAFAIALHDPDELWEVKITEQSVAESTAPEAHVAVADGFTLVGGGAWIDWRWSKGPGNHLISSRPEQDDGSWTAWYAAGHDHSEPCAAAMTVYAIGLRSKVEGIRLSQSVTHRRSSEAHWPTQDVLVASDHVLTGGGAECFHSGKWGQILTASYPRSATTWTASSKDHLKADLGSVAAYVIGVHVEPRRSRTAGR
jgi:hypothetical protein